MLVKQRERYASADLEGDGRWLDPQTGKLQVLAKCNGFRCIGCSHDRKGERELV
jgi:hypothetical protein